MPLFVLLTKLTVACKKKLRYEPKILEEICRKLEGCNQHDFPQLATIGEYNFVNIIEVENKETAYKMAFELNSRGDVETIVMPALPLSKYLNEVKIMNDACA